MNKKYYKNAKKMNDGIYIKQRQCFSIFISKKSNKHSLLSLKML